MKHIPSAILGLTLILALVVLGVGTRISRQEKIEIVGDSRTPSMAFTARFLNAIDDLTNLYQGHLLDLRDSASRTTPLVLVSRARNIIGIEQVTVFNQSERPSVTDVRRGRDADSPLPTPRALGSSEREGGILVDLDSLRADPFGTGIQWLDQPGYQLHFAARIDQRRVIVFRINREIVQGAIREWLEDYFIDEAFESLEAEEVALQVRSSKGIAFAPDFPIESETSPSLIVPVASLFGDWKIATWDKTRTVVSYRLPFLIGAAALSILIALAGLLGYFQQQKAVRLAEQRVSFVNRVSHELRTPLTNILLNIDLTTDSLANNRQDARRRLNLVREETGRLSRLLENVLTFSRREKWKFNDSNQKQSAFNGIPCDLWDLTEDVLSHFQASLDRKQLLVEKKVTPGIGKVTADPDAVSQLISNLISNVEKYAADGDRFEIEIDTCPTDGSRVVLRISDHGPGIRKQDREKIFQPFTRLNDATSEGVSGTGLGLSIARDLAEQMNGTLELKKREDSGNGACFELSLPRSPSNVLTIAS